VWETHNHVLFSGFPENLFCHAGTRSGSSSWFSHTCQGETKPLPLRGPETTQWWQRATWGWDPGVSLHMWREGSVCSLGILLGDFNGGPSHSPFWVIRDKTASDLHGSNYRLCLSPFFKGRGHAWFYIVFRHCPLHSSEKFLSFWLL
jgi:hypothetical protein